MKRGKFWRKYYFIRRLRKIERNRRKRKSIKPYTWIRSHLKDRPFLDPFESFVPIHAPEIFTLQHPYCIKTIEFINQIKLVGSSKRKINIRLNTVIEIGDGAISMMLSVINELVREGVAVVGNKPIDGAVKSKLERSGFFKYARTSIDPLNNDIKNTILTTGDRGTSHQKIAHEVRKSVTTIWSKEARCPELFGGIVEMIRNSCDHAFPEVEQIVWHLGMTHYDQSNTVHFSFVDNGQGVLPSFKSRFVNKFSTFFKDDIDLLKSAFENGIESRTGLKWRGKGLPTIYDLFKEGIICNLVVITNDVYLDFGKGFFVNLPAHFSGTYYYWAMNKDCKKCYFEDED